MHTIPDKLNALRQAMEASQIRICAEIRREFEQKLVDSMAITEENAIKAAVDEVTPQIAALDNGMEHEVPKMRQEMVEVVKVCNESASTAKADALAQVQLLNVELAAIRVELPPLRKHIIENAEAAHRLAAFPPEIREELLGIRAEIATGFRDQIIRLEEEVKRAEAAEVSMAQQIKENAEKSAKGLERQAERSRELSAKAIDHSGCIQDRVLNLLDERERRSADVVEKRLAEVHKAIEPAIRPAIEEVLRQVSDTNFMLEDRIAKTEKEIRGDFKDIMEDVSAAFERSSELKSAELSVTMSENLEITRADIKGVREAGTKALGEAIATFDVHVRDVRGSLDVKMQELEVAISEGEKRLREAAEANEARGKGREGALDDTLALLTLDIQAIKTEHAQVEQQLREDTQKELQEATAKLDRQTKEVGRHCETYASQTAAEVGRKLHAEVQTGLTDVNKLVNQLSGNTDALFAEEKEVRRTGLAEMEQCRVKQLHDCSVDLKAAIASSTAEAGARNEGTNRRVDEIADKLAKLGQGCEAQMETSSSAVSRLERSIKNSGSEIDMAHKALKDAFEDECRSVAEQLRTEERTREHEIQMARNVAKSELQEVLDELPKLAKLEDMKEAVQAAKVALGTSSENTARMNVFETAVDRQRTWFENQSKDLAVRCHDAQSEASDTKHRVQRETSALGTEISMLRGATTSLTHGVIKSLQILGLLTDDLDVLPPKSTDGRSNMNARHWGVDVADLLEWDKTGQGLATRLAKQWQAFESAGLPNMLALVERKANEADVRMLRASVMSVARLPAADTSIPGKQTPYGEKPWTPSTAASRGESRGEYRNASALSGFTSTTPHHFFDEEGSEFAPSPPPPTSESPFPRRPNTGGNPPGSESHFRRPTK